MDYEKKYKEALKRAKNIHKDAIDMGENIRVKQCELIFPELKESEDEKNIKNLIDELKCSLRAANCQNDACGGGHEKRIALLEWGIAWLEKQGKPLENYDEAEKEKADFVGDGFIECHADFLDFKEGNTYWLEYIGDDKYNVRSDNLLGKTYHITPCQLYTVFKKLTWLEKQGEKKSADKVEPKFKVGDWITFYGGEPFKILKVEAEVNGILDYLLLNQNGHDSFYNKKYVDENARLWTIEDAKDGDVLVLSYASQNYIIIYRGLREKSFKTIMSVFCDYNVEEDTFYDETDSFHVINTGEIIKPATKEQRDLLFQKMKEAGYEWDEEKKELKKIEQKPAWSEEDEKMLNNIDITFFEENSIPNVMYWKFMNWLKSLKDRVQSKSQWKPSDEQMDALETAVSSLQSNTLKSLYQDLKREKNYE